MTFFGVKGPGGQGPKEGGDTGGARWDKSLTDAVHDGLRAPLDLLGDLLGGGRKPAAAEQAGPARPEGGPAKDSGHKPWAEEGGRDRANPSNGRVGETGPGQAGTASLPPAAAALLGVPGPVGQQGPVGQHGVVGLQGSVGLRGSAGQQGPVGPQGQFGLQGAIGQHGPGGQQGSAGQHGAGGEQGVVGPQLMGQQGQALRAGAPAGRGDAVAKPAETLTGMLGDAAGLAGQAVRDLAGVITAPFGPVAPSKGPEVGPVRPEPSLGRPETPSARPEAPGKPDAPSAKPELPLAKPESPAASTPTGPVPAKIGPELQSTPAAVAVSVEPARAPTLDAAAIARLETLGSPAAELIRAGAPREVASAADAALRGLQLAASPEGAASLAALQGMPPLGPSALEAARAEARVILGPPAEMPAGSLAAALIASGQPAPIEPGAPLPPGSAGLLAVPRAEAAPGAEAVPLLVALPPGAAAGTAAHLGGGIEAISLPPAAGLRTEAAVLPEAAAFWSRHAAPVVEAVVHQVSPAPDALATPVSLSSVIEAAASAGMTVSLAPGPNGWVVAGAAVLGAEAGLRGAAAPATAPLSAGAPPVPGPGGATIHLGEGTDPRREALGGAFVSVTHPVPVAIDLGPAPGAAPLPEEAPRLWRMDDTAALIAIGPSGPAGAIEEGMGLLARLREGRVTRLADLAPGQGIATWQGSPAHLLLGGIARVGEEGVALGESEPPRIEVIRAPSEEGGWTVLRDGAASRTGEAGEELRLVLAYGLGAPAGPHGGGEGAARAREGIAAALLAMETARRTAEAGRARQAWAGLAGDWVAELARRERLGPPPGGSATPEALAMIAGLHGPLAAWDAMLAGGAAPGPLLRGASPAIRASLAHALASGAALSLSALGQPWEAAAGRAPKPAGLDAAREAFALAAAAVLRGETGLQAAAAALGAWGEAAIRDAPVTRLSRGDGLAIAARLGRFGVPAPAMR